jgi:DNA repair protein RadA/Sms
MKQKTSWNCTSCGHRQTRWSGQCPLCQEWNTLQEEVESREPKGLQAPGVKKWSVPIRLHEIAEKPLERTLTHLSEFNKVLGGGIVPGSLILVGGEPGIGKSTLSLQVANSLAQNNHTVLYVSGEESLEQVAMRAKRLHVESSHLLFSNATEVTEIAKWITECSPHLVIVDSIQILFRSDIPSSPGSVTQVRECTSYLMNLAKTLNVAIIIIGHVTKSGEIAGPRVLEHLVDTVLYFEGEKQQNLRLLRTMKNRFGATDEIAVFQMVEAGLQEIVNPSKLFIEDRAKGTTGSVITPVIEGTRPILIEAQALVTDTFFPSPSRRAAGLDSNRLAILLAVCEKRARFKLHQSDVFVSVTGGLKISEPAADLGFLLAIVSSFANKVFDHDTTVIGEVGLGGEVRAVSRIEARIKEAIQMGFTHCIIPAKNAKNAEPFRKSIKIQAVSWVDEAIDLVL